jgi:hypothetical protein
MAVYVDNLMACKRTMKWPWPQSCHLWADTEEELHVLAAEIGMKREWFQRKLCMLPHYDLTATRRATAIGCGAIPVGRRILVEHIRRHREAVLQNLDRTLTEPKE